MALRIGKTSLDHVGEVGSAERLVGASSNPKPKARDPSASGLRDRIVFIGR